MDTVVRLLNSYRQTIGSELSIEFACLCTQKFITFCEAKLQDSVCELSPWISGMLANYPSNQIESTKMEGNRLMTFAKVQAQESCIYPIDKYNIAVHYRNLIPASAEDQQITSREPPCTITLFKERTAQYLGSRMPVIFVMRISYTGTCKETAARSSPVYSFRVYCLGTPPSNMDSILLWRSITTKLLDFKF